MTVTAPSYIKVNLTQKDIKEFLDWLDSLGIVRVG